LYCVDLSRRSDKLRSKWCLSAIDNARAPASNSAVILTHSCLLCFMLTSLCYLVSPPVCSCWPRLEPLAALLRLVWLRDSMLFEPIGSTAQRECQPRGLCASLDDVQPAGSKCSVLIYYSHNSNSLFNYSVDVSLDGWPWAYASNRWIVLLCVILMKMFWLLTCM